MCLNVLKTKEVVVDLLPLIINNIEEQQVDNYKFLGGNISSTPGGTRPAPLRKPARDDAFQGS